MVEFELRKTTWRFDLLFFIILGIGCVFFPKLLICAANAILIHETTHLIFMCFFEQRIKKIHFLGVSILILPYPGKMLTFWEITVMYISAPIMNLICAFCFKDINPLFATCNLYFGLFNILPSKSLDGGTVLINSLENIGIFTEKIMKILSVVTAVVMVIFMMFTGKLNFFLCYMGIFVIIDNFVTEK